MSTPAIPPDATATAHLKLAGADWELEADVTVPAGPTRLRHILPMVQALAGTVVDACANSAEERGQHITCKKGCGACCRQLVPVSQTEARNLRDVVAAMPEPRRAHVHERFADALQRLESGGLLDALRDRAHWTHDNAQPYGMAYFDQGVPCPFLEDESCSIYEDRPSVCREYLVTSPVEECARPQWNRIDRLPVPFRVWTALASFDARPAGSPFLAWVPLTLALEWAENTPDDGQERPGPELLREFFSHLSGKDNAAIPPFHGPAIGSGTRPPE